jgi:undecaprenyl pyrophosphate phosphatase UppP
MMDFAFSFLSNKDILRVIPFIITLAALLLAYFMPQDDLKSLLILVALILAFSIRKFDSRIPIIYAIVLLLIAGVLTSQKADDSVKKLALISYWLLVVGIIAVLIDFYRKTTPVQTVA